MKTFAGEGEYLLTSVGRVEVLSLLKTGALAPLNRLKGASDAAENPEEFCFHLGEILFPPTATVICHDCCE